MAHPRPVPCRRPDPDKDKKRDPCASGAIPPTRHMESRTRRCQRGRHRSPPLTRCPGNTRGSRFDQPLQGRVRVHQVKAAAGEGEGVVRVHLLHGETRARRVPSSLHGPGDML